MQVWTSEGGARWRDLRKTARLGSKRVRTPFASIWHKPLSINATSSTPSDTFFWARVVKFHPSCFLHNMEVARARVLRILSSLPEADWHDRVQGLRGIALLAACCTRAEIPTEPTEIDMSKRIARKFGNWALAGFPDNGQLEQLRDIRCIMGLWLQRGRSH